jgi:hypothetical protein
MDATNEVDSRQFVARMPADCSHCCSHSLSLTSSQTARSALQDTFVVAFGFLFCDNATPFRRLRSTKPGALRG